MLLHNGFIGKIEYDDRRDLITGEVVNARDLLEFSGTDAREVRKNFIKCVEDYCTLHQNPQDQESIPFIGNYTISLTADKQNRVMREAKREATSMEVWLNRRMSQHLDDYFRD